ncbi:integrase catalytic domain-containing protein [Trichonephila clavipes]|nr:integrase catalytic domain-containing protein [Trichonephila clavipes]
MFRQILVNEDDVEFQRIFWRERPEEPLKEYRLLTVTYGTACAPYLSIITIQQLVEEEIKKFPEASKVALEDFYVDDLITGTNSKEDAKKLASQVIELMKKGGFPIRKWAPMNHLCWNHYHQNYEVLRDLCT